LSFLVIVVVVFQILMSDDPDFDSAAAQHKTREIGQDAMF
jgi:hypothetical protein